MTIEDKSGKQQTGKENTDRIRRLDRRRFLAITGATTGALTIGAGQVGAESTKIRRSFAEIPDPEDYNNPSGQDIVAWLPGAPADHRIQYGSDPLQFGDLRLPDKTHPGGYPVAVFVHGGGWSSNWNLDYSQPLVEALTNAGVATWNIEYRRMGNDGGGWPGSYLDVGEGYDHLRELADEFDLDLDRVVVIGHSSGGNFSHWLAGRHNIPEGTTLHTPDPLPVSGAVSLAGTLDLELRQQIGPPVILDLLDVESEEEAQPRYAQASPRHLLPLDIPQEVIIGSEDSDYLIEVSEAYVEAATKAGDDVNYTFLEGANHFDIVDPCGPAWPLIAEAVFSLMDYSPPPGKVKTAGTRFCPLG